MTFLDYPFSLKDFDIPALINRMLVTLMLALLIFALRFFFIVLARRRHSSRAQLNRWRLTSLYLSLFTLIVIALPLWISSLQSVMAFVGIFGAGILIVIKEVILNVAGWFYIIVRRPFDVGNRVKVGDHIGDVLELRLLDFSMIEVRHREDGGQSTGRVLHIPNSLLFTQPLANSSKEFSLYWNEIRVPLTPASDWERARAIVLEVAASVVDRVHESDGRLRAAEERYAIHYAALEPSVFVEYRDNAVWLFLRHLSEPRKVRLITDQFWRTFLARIALEENITLFSG
ncbi:MAG: mechanosensitive ion channel [Spirochaetales bacterium]|nr:mechanosensitive ion channel [Leptospiraceae bacterium]MCP5479854.1 mechanosensitive ion channel [Spirochaetales bacterium]MCP5486244.1 mechanosensitive ion channel [Spirochaetales bacterium]